ncbi:MAG: pyridoxine 5'-phosphate synthase [bacterium]
MILGVNVDHVATIRQARKGHEPDPVMAATLAILGGADGITIHLREDRRHIQDRDLNLLREVVRIELNLEMAATDEMIRIALRTKPDMVTLVPEKRAELTTEGGLNLRSNPTSLRKRIGRLRDSGIPVSLFINPDLADVDRSKELGADMIEIHTGLYANSKGNDTKKEYHKVINAVKRAIANNLSANAGHGLNYTNVQPIARIEGIRGLYIGHSIVSRSLFVGLEEAVRQMKALIESSR